LGLCYRHFSLLVVLEVPFRECKEKGAMLDINTVQLPGLSTLFSDQDLKAKHAFAHVFDDAADIRLSGLLSTLRENSRMPSNLLPSLFATISASCLLLGCQLTEPKAGMPAFGSLAQITSISPDTIHVLRSGEQVNLKVDVSYVLTAESGTIKLVVLAADNSDLAQDFEVITKGSWKSTLVPQHASVET